MNTFAENILVCLGQTDATFGKNGVGHVMESKMGRKMVKRGASEHVLYPQS